MRQAPFPGRSDDEKRAILARSDSHPAAGKNVRIPFEDWISAVDLAVEKAQPGATIELEDLDIMETYAKETARRAHKVITFTGYSSEQQER